jgi:protein-S-isoprenylcysteine O-methyltransferase Ste14
MKQKSLEILGYIVNCFTIIIYFSLLFVLKDPPGYKYLPILGWFLFVSGIAFIILAIITLHGEHTAAVITVNVFSVVRHPMYLGASLLYLSMVCFLPHWIIISLSIVNVLIIYWFMVIEEKKNIKKFGGEYARYMQSVPRANLFAGFFRLLVSKRREW